MWAVVVAVALAALALATSAGATFSGENGRIFYVTGSYSATSTVMSVCPNGGHVKTVMPLATFVMPSPDGSKIAYVKITLTGSGFYDFVDDGIWVADADGSNPVRITDSKYSDAGPSWSPDGTKLTFRRFVEYEGTSVMQPVVVDIATKVVTPLLSDKQLESATEDPSPNVWSPDGSNIYFLASTSRTGSDVYRVPAGGGTATRVLGDDNDLPFSQWIDIAPAGDSMMVMRQTTFSPESLSETRRYDQNGGGGTLKLAELTEAGNGDEALTYSPDGTRILFDRLSTNKFGSTSYSLMTADFDGSNPVPLGVGGALQHWSTNTDDCTDPGAATIKINEVGLGDGQFVELLDSADEAFPSGEGPYKVVAYDAAGARQGAHTISSSLLQGRDNTKPLLLSTAAADTSYGVKGDEALSVGLPNPGQACFTQGIGESKVSCVSWGCISNAVTPSSTPIPAPAAGVSAQRQGIGSSTFQLATPTPKAANVAGTTAEACPAPGGDGGGGAAVPPPSGGSGGNTPLPIVQKKAFKCRKGFKRRQVKGKAKCVKVKKHSRGTSRR